MTDESRFYRQMVKEPPKWQFWNQAWWSWHRWDQKYGQHIRAELREGVQFFYGSDPAKEERAQEDLDRTIKGEDPRLIMSERRSATVANGFADV